MKAVEYGRATGPICVFIGFFLVGLLWTGACGAGSEYPTHTITMVVPWPAGGTTDLAARGLAESMQKHLKRPVVVLNKPGGNTTVGGYAIASAKPDGYTLGYVNPSAVIPEAFAYFQEAPYSSKRPFIAPGVSIIDRH